MTSAASTLRLFNEEVPRNKQGPNFTRISSTLCLDKAGKTFPFGQELIRKTHQSIQSDKKGYLILRFTASMRYAGSGGTSTLHYPSIMVRMHATSTKSQYRCYTQRLRLTARKDPHGSAPSHSSTIEIRLYTFRSVASAGYAFGTLRFDGLASERANE
jgi:hypothetical protein